MTMGIFWPRTHRGIHLRPVLSKVNVFVCHCAFQYHVVSLNDALKLIRLISLASLGLSLRTRV